MTAQERGEHAHAEVFDRVSRVPDFRRGLSLEGVTKRYGGLTALDGVSVIVPAGTIHAVIGASGAGKSTLFRCVATLDTPDEGRIVHDGVDLAWLRGAPLVQARQRLGAVFQDLHLLPSRTAADNIGLPLELAGQPRAVIEPRIHKLLRWVGLSSRAHSYPSELSGGQRQRVALARALATEPSLLLCDEPTSALDPHTARSMLELLERCRDELGVTVLLITHHLDAVRQICDSATLLDAGRVVATGGVGPVLARATLGRGGL